MTAEPISDIRCLLRFSFVCVRKVRNGNCRAATTMALRGCLPRRGRATLAARRPSRRLFRSVRRAPSSRLPAFAALFAEIQRIRRTIRPDWIFQADRAAAGSLQPLQTAAERSDQRAEPGAARRERSGSDARCPMGRRLLQRQDRNRGWPDISYVSTSRRQRALRLLPKPIAGAVWYRSRSP